MVSMPRQAAFTAVSSSLLLNVYAAEIERVVAGTFGNLTNLGRPRVLVSRTTTFSVPNVTDTTVPWQFVVTDPRTMWNAGVPDVLTVKDAGDWLFFGQERWPADPTGIRAGKVMKNGTNPNSAGVTQSSSSANSINSGEGTTLSFLAFCRLAVNDLMRLNGFQASGGTASLQVDFGSTFFGGVWLGP